ncbi:MAG: DJ-1/PfpI/YhbO family deglycase/protease [bacterium]|jgi:protease I|nr:DJ-1/PfpI/YhbO family deglycase/protease [candidate division KSB1 bacterium]MDH7560376.1 DJ-1/PfpI/YhbO family deglycase/protease [bacterium]
MPLKGKRVAILVAPRFHDEQTTSPRDFLARKGAKVEYLGTYKSRLAGKNGRHTVEVTRTFEEADPSAYDGIVIPGGEAPQILRLSPEVLSFVRQFWSQGGIVGAICHGPQVLISAQLLAGKKLTCYPGIRDDVVLAGGLYEDSPVLIDGQLITSRRSEDLPEFNRALAEALAARRPTAEATPSEALQALALAVAREQGAQEFYQAAGERFTQPAIRNKFLYLAAVEQEHFQQLSELYRTLTGGPPPDPGKKRVEVTKRTLTKDMTVEQAISVAMDAERAAYDFYLAAAGRARSAKARDMFRFLAEQEQEHYRLLSVDLAAHRGGTGHFQWATFWDIPPGMEDLW